MRRSQKLHIKTKGDTGVFTQASPGQLRGQCRRQSLLGLKDPGKRAGRHRITVKNGYKHPSVVSTCISPSKKVFSPLLVLLMKN